MRGLVLAWLLASCACLTPAGARAAPPAIEIGMLAGSAAQASATDLASGSLDARFQPFDLKAARQGGGPFWLRLRCAADYAPAGLPALVVRTGRQLGVRLFTVRGAAAVEVPAALSQSRFRGTHDVAFVVAAGVRAGEALYARIEPLGGHGSEELAFSWSTLESTLAAGASRARMIGFAFGALAAMSLAALLIWFVLSERLVLLYASLFSLQALYVAYVSGQGFDWPVLELASGLMPHAWNVPAAFSGAIACLFAREIADLRRFSPREYVVFGWLAGAFVVIAFANVAQVFGFGWLVAAIGNLLFVGTAAFTLVVAFLAWRRGSRSAGWFLLAWSLLETITIATATRLLFGRGEDADLLLYDALPLSMVTAAVLVALGVADRMREQRRALSEAERRAQIDPLTGVLNRRSLIERLEAACLRAQARGLPISLLFIDVDHFKTINDSYGHAAGDACLQALTASIQAELRQSDVVGRYGGEEFIVILSSAGAGAAHPIAERIVQRVAELRVAGFGAPIRLTCSIGVAASDVLEVWGEALIARADAAVYAAKHSGRNRVQLASPLAA